MTRFQLLFRMDDGDRVELRDSSSSGEPHVNGVELLDGMIFAHGDRHWLARREDSDGMVRFICTPAQAPGVA